MNQLTGCSIGTDNLQLFGVVTNMSVSLPYDQNLPLARDHWVMEQE